MDFVYKIRNSVVEYLSPAKRRRMTGPTTPSKGEDEHAFANPASEPQGRKARIMTEEVIRRQHVSNTRKRTFEEYEEVGGALKPEDSISQAGESGVTDGGSEHAGEFNELDNPATETGADDNLEELSVADDEQDLSEGFQDVSDQAESSESVDEEAEPTEEETASEEARAAALADEKVKAYLATQNELALSRAAFEKAKAARDWHPDIVILFERLALRSYEEILPADYKMDFPTLPVDIFATSSRRDTFVNYNCRSSGAAVRALQSLLRLGVRARDRIEVGGTPTPVIAKGVTDYVKWSERDGGYSKKRFLPTLVVVAAQPQQSSDDISAVIGDQMTFLAEQHRNHLALPDVRVNEASEIEKFSSPPPLLYGILIAQTVVIFVSMDSADDNLQVKHLTHFDFKEKAMDVWNGFAIAFVVILARNYTMSMKDTLEAEEEVTDPDL